MLKHFDEIKNFLPHREPFLFIDEIVEVDVKTDRVLCHKCTMRSVQG